MDETSVSSEDAAVSVERPDPWSIWFSRLMQVVGLLLMIHEAVRGTDRPYLLLGAMAMMLGGVGLQLVIRWMLRRLS